MSIDKQRIAQSFSKAAMSYDAHAPLQQQVGSDLLELLQQQLPEKCACQYMMDLGCGTGYFSEPLQQLAPNASLVLSDLALGMLQHCQRQLVEPASYVCADAESLPFQAETFDVVFSSLAIQWCTDITTLWHELSRITHDQGLIAISTLGQRSLYELKQAWQQVDDYTHVNRFLSLDELLNPLPSGLKVVICQTQDYVMQYEQLRELTQSLKGIGAHNMNQDQAKGLTAPARIKQFKAAYEAYRQSDGFLPATYEVHHIILRKTDGKT